MKLFVKGDIDGFFALGLDNLLMLMLMSSLCQGFLGFSSELFFTQILPATAVGLAIGNIYYARTALKLARKENRTDVCALPYGTSILTVVAFVFLAMYPVQQVALSNGLTKEEADLMAWRAGLLACFGSGLIEFFGSFVVYHIRRFTPRAAMLATLAGIGFTFIATDFIFRSFAYPLVGLTTLGLTMLVYFGGVRLKLGLPVGFVILALGTALAWFFYRDVEIPIVPGGPLQPEMFGLHIPLPVFGDLFAAFTMLPQLLPVLAPVGIIHLILSLQIIESAEAAGDRYEPKPALAVNGLGTLAAAVLGSPFPTSIYIGHPGWKALGARAGYSLINATVLGLFCITGTASLLFHYVPVEAGMAVLIWIGVSMMTQAFDASPKKHIPAVVLGIFPPVGAYVSLCIKHGLSTGGVVAGTNFYEAGILKSMAGVRNFFVDGAFAMEQGYVYTSIILAASTVCIIERKFRAAAWWYVAAAVFAAIGLTHQYAFTPGDTVSKLSLEFNEWFWGYLIVAGILFIAPWITRENGAGVPH
ncbi:MAG: NCS2 family permease [Verrucomicrobiae bacterium]|nr:NCS2 family permease [Verrucomicrobiae bacterium]